MFDALIVTNHFTISMFFCRLLGLLFCSCFCSTMRVIVLLLVIFVGAWYKNVLLVKDEKLILPLVVVPSLILPCPVPTYILYDWMSCPMVFPNLSFAWMMIGISHPSIIFSVAGRISIVLSVSGNILMICCSCIQLSSACGRQNCILIDDVQDFLSSGVSTNVICSEYGLYTSDAVFVHMFAKFDHHCFAAKHTSPVADILILVSHTSLVIPSLSSICSSVFTQIFVVFIEMILLVSYDLRLSCSSTGAF